MRIRRPSLLSAYVATVVIAGFGLLAWLAWHTTFHHLSLFVSLLAGSVLISASKIHLPIASGNATLSMSYFTDFASLVLLGPDMATFVAAASGATQCLLATRSRTTVRQTLFSVAALVITMQAAGWVSSSFGGFPPAADLAALSRPTVAAAATFFFCNSWLVAGAVSLSRRQPLIRTWQQNFIWTAPACFVGAGVAVLAVRVVMTMPIWLVLLVAAPLYLTYRSYRIYLGRVEDQQRYLKQVSDLHLASVEALARAIDARDQTIDRSSCATDNHIRRVQAAAAELARAAGMAANEVEGVKVAALLHDIGKLAVPEHILTKPGRLTPEEFDRVRVHPSVGAEIIRAVPFPYPVAPFIQSHHERWDGSGYPEGLAGEQIPLGARVLAVVDYYDALTAIRPYHAAMPETEAVGVLRSEAGKALDPDLVELFVPMLPSLQLGSSGSHAGQVTSERPGAHPSAPVTGFSRETQPAAPAPNVFENISRATQEMHALYDIAQTLGTRLSVNDTMALLTSKLSRLVPTSCCALYLYDPESHQLHCRFASALTPDIVDSLRIGSGEGASGWAARHRTPAVNARAGADFDAAGCSGGTAFKAALAYPLIDGDVLVGTLTLYHVDENPYRHEHRQLLGKVCRQVASVIRNSVLFEQMHQVSLTDSLTDLPNGRALFAYLNERFAAAASARPSALLMVDLDDFKAINDEHGHQVGDMALRQVAAAIRQKVRQTDFCARYAGDEFVVVLHGCERREAEWRAAHIQEAVSALEIDVRPGVVLRPAISIGVAVGPEDGATYEDLLSSADQRMYANKEQRRLWPGRAAGRGPGPWGLVKTA